MCIQSTFVALIMTYHKLADVEQALADDDRPWTKQWVKGEEIQNLNPAEQKRHSHELKNVKNTFLFSFNNNLA